MNLDLQNYEIIGALLSYYVYDNLLQSNRKLRPRHIAYMAKNKNVDIPSMGENVECT